LALSQQFEFQNKELKSLFAHKIGTINTEIGVIAEPAFIPKFQDGLSNIFKALDAIVFSGQNNLLPLATVQGFYNQDLDFLFDMQGNEGNATLVINANSRYLDGRLSSIEADAAPDITDRQQLRKNGAENMLQEQGVLINRSLPFTPDAKDVKMRNKKEVVNRALACFICCVKGEGGVETQQLVDIATQLGVLQHLTAEEKAFLYNENPTEQERTAKTWHYEAVWTLFWALSYIAEQYGPPTAICPVENMAKFVISHGAEKLHEMAVLRDANTLLDQLDLTYRCHWAVVNARIKGQEPPAGIDAGIIYERHFAMNWLTSFQNPEYVLWDEVATHT
jgi:Domain of unknown function (DUF4272)